MPDWNGTRGAARVRDLDSVQQLIVGFNPRAIASCDAAHRADPARHCRPIMESTSHLSSTLARWYAEQPSVRHLRAFEHSQQLRVLLMLEPSSDGDDALPLWFANNVRWTRELASLTRRDVQLQLIDPSNLATDVDTRVAVVANLSWRDPWDFLQR